jgi:hypothetical protein
VLTCATIVAWTLGARALVRASAENVTDRRFFSHRRLSGRAARSATRAT